METDDLISELLPIYIGELHENANLVVQELLSLEKEINETARLVLFESIFRTIHSLKGASRAVGLTTTASVCHEMENILSAGHGGAPLVTSDYQLLFNTFDTLEAMAQLLQTGDQNAERHLAPLLFSLKEAGAKLQPAKSSAEYPHSHPPIEDSRAAGSRSPQPGASFIENSVRLPLAKLDRLLTDGSDLITVSNRNAACLADVDQLQRKIVKWQRLAKQEKIQQETNQQATLQQEKHQQEKSKTDDVHDWLRLLSKDLEQVKFSLQNENRHLSAAISHVTDGINGLRMLPIGLACQGIDRIVRDLAIAGNKQIQLKLSGMEVEVDSNVLELLKDPLMHLVRNACDHGIESSEERSKCGKLPKATIAIKASVLGSQVEIAVADDGRGISFDTVCARAKKLSLPPPENETEMKDLLFSKGFSTSPIITEISGRGIGLDVVRDKIERLHGSVDLDTKLQSGTTFTVTVPITLTSMRVLFVRAGGQLFAIATASIQRLLRILPDHFKSMEGTTVLPMGDAPVPVAALSQILDLSPFKINGAKIPAIVLIASDQKAIILVEELVGEQEILVKNLGGRIKRVKHISASTIMPNGQIALIINAAEVLRSALTQAQPTLERGGSGVRPGVKVQKQKLLLVDDSITTRSLEKHLLESAGFDVTTCADGAQAWQTMQERHFDGVVSDVEMPRMDGFALTRKIKSSPRHLHIPVILVTALASERHKALGIAAGADAYLVKSEVERCELLEVINQLL